MNDQNAEPTPQERAQRAVEMITAEGGTVSVRTVKARAGVSTLAATEAVKTFKGSEPQIAVPDLPETVQRRFQAMWEAAFLAARDQFDAERSALQQRLAEVDARADSLNTQMKQAAQAAEEAIRAVQQERDAAVADRDAARTEVHRLQEALHEAENRAAAAEGLTAGLREGLTAVKAAFDERDVSDEPTTENN